jgi:hypothetical protein
MGTGQPRAASMAYLNVAHFGVQLSIALEEFRQ